MKNIYQKCIGLCHWEFRLHKFHQAPSYNRIFVMIYVLWRYIGTLTLLSEASSRTEWHISHGEAQFCLAVCWGEVRLLLTARNRVYWSKTDHGGNRTTPGKTDLWINQDLLKCYAFISLTYQFNTIMTFFPLFLLFITYILLCDVKNEYPGDIHFHAFCDYFILSMVK